MVSAIGRAKRALVSLLQNFVALHGMTPNLSRESPDAAVRAAYSARAFARASRAPARAGVRAPARPRGRAPAHPRARARKGHRVREQRRALEQRKKRRLKSRSAATKVPWISGGALLGML